MTDEILDAEVVAEPVTELTVAAPPSTLFRTDDPVEVLQRATEVANALAPAIQDRNLFANISGKKHITVEGWQTLGAMLGVTPVCAWTRPVDEGWEARVEARTLDGRVIGAAEAQCLRSERMWKSRDDYALRSMAQTRATSKSLGSVLRFIVTLAGYEGTPAEEMPTSDPGPEAVAQAEPEAESPIIEMDAAKALVDAAWGVPAAKAQFQLALAHKLGEDPGDCGSKVKAIAAASKLTVDQAAGIFKWIERKADGDE